MSFYYNLSKHAEERAIRKFEIDATNLEESDYLKKFAWVYPIICLNAKVNNKKIENIFKENFDPQILKLIAKEYFKRTNEDGEPKSGDYDIRKIRILILLLTSNSFESDVSDKVR